MSREHVYSIEMLDGSVQDLTAREAAAKFGLDLQFTRRRLRVRRVRTEAGLREPAEVAMAKGRQAFLRGTTAHFNEEKRKRAAEAAHMEEVESGHAKL